MPQVKCVKCHQNIDSSNKFCPYCGAPVLPEISDKTLLCPKCGYQNVLGSSFCEKCGTSLKTDSSSVKPRKQQSIKTYSSSGNYSGTMVKSKSSKSYKIFKSIAITILNFRVADCMGSTASTSVSIEVVENIADEIVDNSPKGLEGCWIGWTVCGYKDVKCPMFQYFFKVKNKERYYVIYCWIDIINDKITYHCEDGMTDENIKDRIIKGSGWELFKFSYPNIPEIPEISNELYQKKIIEFTRQLKETKDENEQISLENYINSMNERIRMKDLSSVFYETAIMWTRENKWSKFDYTNQNSDDYNGYSNWWVCPDDVLREFGNSVNNNR